MNNLILRLDDIRYTVDRPITFDIIKQLMDITEISSETPIRFMGDENKGLQAGSGIDNKQIKNLWPFDKRITIEISDEFDKDRILSTPVLEPNTYPIFYDKEINTYIRPIYGNNVVTFTIKYRTSDRNEANSWINLIKTKTSMNRDYNIHKVNYSYKIPDACIIVLKEIHRLRENVAGYGDTFEEYLSTHLSSNVNTVSNSNGNQYHYSVSEAQGRILGIYDFEGIPDKPEKDGDSSAYTATFTYKVTYDKPINVNFRYDFVIHNQILSRKYREMSKPYMLEANNTSYSLQNLAFSSFEQGIDILKAYGNIGISIPSFDYVFNSFNTSKQKYIAKIFHAVCGISESDKRSLLNLKELGDFNLHQSLLDFILFDKENIVKMYRSILVLQLYSNENLISGVLNIDDDLNVTSNVDLDLRKTYRIKLGLIVNLDSIDRVNLNRIRRYNLEHHDLAVRLVNAINSYTKSNATSSIRTRLNLSDYIRIGLVHNPINPHSNLPINVPKTVYDDKIATTKLVENLFIVAKHMKDA